MKKEYQNNYLKTIDKINLPLNIITRIFLSKFSPLNKNFKNKKILDYSCGSGPYLKFFQLIGLKVYATEITSLIVKKLRIKFNKINFKISTNKKIKFPNNFFNYIVCNHSIYYLENSNETLTNTINEILRCLKKGGILICTFPKKKQSHLKFNKIKKNIYKIIYDKYKIRKDGFFYIFKSKKEIINFFNKKFFVIEVGEQIINFKNLEENFYIALLKKK